MANTGGVDDTMNVTERAGFLTRASTEPRSDTSTVVVVTSKPA
jgi:hypothetical protein